MVWTIEIDAGAEKQLGKLNKSDARRIRDFLREQLMGIENPRRIGKALIGKQYENLGDIGSATIGLSAVSRTNASSFSSSRSDIAVKSTDRRWTAT